METPNIVLPIYNGNGSSFHGLELSKFTFFTTVMALNDKIEASFFYKDNTLPFTLSEYVEYKGAKYVLMYPPTVVKKGLVSDNTENKGMTKYSCTFYHQMTELYNIPFTDVAIDTEGTLYQTEKRTFSWMGTLTDLVKKINRCLEGTRWSCALQSNYQETGELSNVISFSDNFISDVCKTAYETYKVPFTVDGFTIYFGEPSNEILDKGGQPYVFKFGQGVGLKNNDCTPRNNKVITRIAGYGSSQNIPYGYPIIYNAAGERVAHPYTRDTLMPSIYVESVKRKVLDNVNSQLVDYYDADSSYPTPINPVAPVFHIQPFSDIFPTLEGMTYNGVPIDEFQTVYTPEGGWDSTIDKDTGDIKQPHFEVSLPALGFDLYAQAAVTQVMTFSMKSGPTIGANYEVAVDWDDVKRNFYVTDDDGNVSFVPDGSQRDYAKYPDSTNASIKIKLTKDMDTYGVLMPNKNQHPAAGNKFVLLGIEMPQKYITEAEKRLDSAMQKYMRENNIPYHDYPLTFDEAFLTLNPDLLNQISTNTLVRFEYAGSSMVLSVKEMTVQYGSSILPKYNITLTDDVSIVLNQIGQIADGLSKLGSQVAALQAIYGLDITSELNKKLSRVKDDVAQGMITFLKGIKIGSFTSGTTGGIFYADPQGRTHAEMDFLTVRMKAFFYSLEIIKTGVIGGRQIITPGGGFECIKIEDREDILDEEGNKTDEKVWDYWRCYFYADDGTTAVTNRFRVGDQALAQDFNIKEGVYENVSNHYFWRLVVGVGPDYVDISKTDADTSSDAPQVGDSICQLGNRNDPTRQNALIFSAVDTFSPSITLYAGINSYSYLDKDYITYGVDKTTNQAYQKIYGNSYIGARDESTYIKYDQSKGVEIKGTLVTKSGQNVDDALNNFQDQLDGVKETWYGEYTPTLTNAPAVSWTTEKEKERHEGDVFTNIQNYVDDATTPDAGKSWRWVKTGNTWGWLQIADNDTSKAYLEAAKAAKAAKEAAEAANKANTTITNMRDFTDEAFKDGIVDRSEATAIRKYINNIQSIKASVDEAYAKVYNNSLLTGVPKAELKTSYDGFSASVAELITTIETSIADGIATDLEIAAVDGKYDTFNVKYGDFTAYLNAANKFIQDSINATASEAKKLAENAQKIANEVNTKVGEVNTTVTNMKNFTDVAFKDGIIDRSEAVAIEKYTNDVNAQKALANATYEKLYANEYLIGDAKTDLDNKKKALFTAIDNLLKSINTAITDGIATAQEKADVDSKFALFNTALGNFNTSVEAANKAIQDRLKGFSDEALKAAKAASTAAGEAKTAAGEAKTAVTNLNAYVDGAFADGIIEESEAKAIEKYINTINSTKSSADATYGKLFTNVYLTGEAKSYLSATKTGLDTSITTLIKAVNDAISDGKTTAAEKTNVDNYFTAFNLAYSTFNSAIEVANVAIQDRLKKYSEDAQKAAEEAKGVADNAIKRLNEWAADGVISPTEKQGVKDEIARIDSDKDLITQGFTLYGLGDPAAYNLAHKNYREVLVKLSADTPETIVIPLDFSTKQKAYYTQRTSALSDINSASKKATDTIKTDLAGYKYIKDAWKESTTVDGGLILSSLAQFGYTDANNNFKIMSGINGISKAELMGQGIAAWYGGDMIDRANYTQENMPENAAKAVIRMDGSGYLASGAVWWGLDGKFHADPLSFLIEENDLGSYLKLFQIVYTDPSKKQIRYMIPQYPMQQVQVANYIEIGTTGLRIGYDATNNALKVYKEDGSTANFYATGAVTAKGAYTGGGGGGGGTSYDRLDEWSQYSSVTTDWVLSAKLGWDLHTRVQALESSDTPPITITSTGTGNGLAGFTQEGSVVTFTKATFLTSHQTLYGLTIQKNGTAVGTYTPSAAKTINITVPTKLSELSNDGGYVLQSYVDSNFPKLVSGLIPSSFLPSYVDDVLEYTTIGNFPSTGETGKIYVATNTNLTYRWSGTGYVEISPSLALGETSSTAYAGNKGKANADAIAALRAITISAGTGLSGGGNLTANRTLTLKAATTSALGGVIVGDRLSVDANGKISATYTYTLPTASASTLGGVKVGTTLEISSGVLNQRSGVVTVGTYTKLTVDTYGRVTSGTTLVAGDIPTLAISKISGLQAALDAKLAVSVFNDLFEKVNIGTSSAPVYAIRAKYGFYSDSFITAKGSFSSGGSGGGGLIESVYGYNDLGKSFSNTNLTDTFNAYTINELAKRLSVVEGGGGLSSVTVKLGTTSYNSVDGVVSLPAYPTSLPASDVYAWAKAATKPSYAWTEITSKPSWIGASKPSYAFSEITGKPTTLGGYGITDAPTKTGGGASGTWGISISGNAASSSASTYSQYMIGGYISTGMEKPNWTYFGSGKLRLQMLHGANNLGLSGWSWADVLWMSAYTGSDVKGSHALVLGKTNNFREMYIFFQNNDVTTWDATPARVLTNQNYNLYAPSHSGANASGTWGISVTGNAATATKLATSRALTVWDSGAIYAGAAAAFDGTANIALKMPSTIYASVSFTAKDRRFNECLAYYNSGTSTITGTICITLPNGFNSSMNIYEIYLYEYNSNNASIITVGGYNYGAGKNWVNTAYHTKGQYSKGIRLGYNGSKCVILLGITTTAWNYPQVFLKSVLTGFSSQTDWATGYSISVITSESGYSSIYTPSRTTEYFGDVTAKTITGTLSGNASTATVASKLGTATVGGTARGIYLNAGVATAMSATVGNSGLPVYLNSGTITACSNTFLTSANYNNYSPSLTGTKASGTWAISITGNAATASKSDFLKVNDIRNTNRTPNDAADRTLEAWFNATGTPTGDWWSGITVAGWNNTYAVWQLAGISNSAINSSHLYYRVGVNSTWNAWKALASLDDNVASATKLLTTRTLWGQSFNGTQNVSGSLTGVANISINGYINNKLKVEDTSDWSTLKFGGTHNVAFGGFNEGYAHRGYCFRPAASPQGYTTCDVYIQNGLTDGSSFDTRHAFYSNGRAVHVDYVQGTRFISTVGTGTAPLTVASTTQVANLNVSYLEGMKTNVNAVANTIVIRNGSNYAYFNYINSNTAEAENPTIGQFIVINTAHDGFYRKASMAHVKASLNRVQAYSLDLRSLDANTWYPCTMVLTSNMLTEIAIWVSLGGNKPTWATHASGFTLNLRWTVAGSGWGATNVQRTILNSMFQYAASNPCGGIEQNTMESREIVYLRGGALYYYNTNDGRQFTINSSGYSWTSGSYSYSAPTRTSVKANPLDCYSASVLGVSDIRTSNLGVGYSATVGTTLTVTGATTLKSTLSVGSWLSVASSAAIAGSLDVSGATTLSSTLSVSSTSTLNGAVRTSSNYGFNGNNTRYSAGSIELYAATPFIDFHFNNSTADYTSRIIESASGRLQFTGQTLHSGNAYFGSTSYYFNNAGDISARTASFSSTVNISGTLGVNAIKQAYIPGTWISTATRTDIIQGDRQQTTASAHGLIRLKNSSGSVICYGGLGTNIGFYGFTKSIIDAGTNAYSWCTYWNVDTGTLTHSKNFSVSGATTLGNTLTVSSTSTLSGVVNAGSTLNVTGATTLSSTLSVSSTTTVGGVLNNTNTTDATSTTAAAMKTAGGLGVAKQLRVGGATTLASTLSVSSTTTLTGRLTANGGMSSGYSNTSYQVSVSSFICSSWIRTTGQAGWYSETYGGGIYMTDSTYVRIYNSKKFYVSNAESTDFSTATAISTAGGIYAAKNITSSANIYAAGAITAKVSSSDMNLKTDVRDYDALSIIRSLKSIKYHWNKTAKAYSPALNHNDWNYGLKAQELIQKGYNQWVGTAFEYYTIDYERLSAVMWRGIQQIDDEQALLKKRIEALEREVLRLGGKLPA